MTIRNLVSEVPNQRYLWDIIKEVSHYTNTVLSAEYVKVIKAVLYLVAYKIKIIW